MKNKDNRDFVANIKGGVNIVLIEWTRFEIKLSIYFPNRLR